MLRKAEIDVSKENKHTKKMLATLPMKSPPIPYSHFTDEERTQITEDFALFEAYLKQMENRISNKEHGFFGPDSMTWKLYRKPFVLIGSMRAILLQIAHPAIAEGVKKYSNFHKEYFHRAHRTFTAMATLYFGNTQQSMEIARHLYWMHNMIRGEVTQRVGDETITRNFVAKDPDLLCWVLATLVDTTMIIHEKVYGPLNLDEKEQFFQESKITASLMGVPPEAYPDDLYHFYTYYRTMLRSDQLQVGDTAQGLADIILNPPYLGRRLLVLLAKGTLPVEIAKAYDLIQTRRTFKRFDWLIRLARFLYRITPRFLHYAPPYYQAHYRVKKSHKRLFFHLGRLYDWLSKTLNLPFLLKGLSQK